MAQQHNSSLDVFKKLVVFFFAGVAVFIGLVLLVYALTLLFDKCCGSWSNLPSSTAGAMMDEDTDQGPVARKAGLWGLTLEERNLILRRLFQPILYRGDETTTKTTTTTSTPGRAVDIDADDDYEMITFTSEDDDEHQSQQLTNQIPEHDESQQQLKPADDKKDATPAIDIESQQDQHHQETHANKNTKNNQPSNSADHKQQPEVDEENQQTSSIPKLPSSAADQAEPAHSTRRSSPQDVDVPIGDDDDDQENQKNHSNTANAATTTINGLAAVGAVVDNNNNNTDLDHTCSICYHEYAFGDTVVSGKGCSHLFHYECVMQWLERHDDCPYCRKEMMTAAQMREAALCVLGEERVSQMGPQLLFAGINPHNNSNNNEMGTNNSDNPNGVVPNNTLVRAIRSASGRWLRRDDDDGY